jgi:hypothetical protein
MHLENGNKTKLIRQLNINLNAIKVENDKKMRQLLKENENLKKTNQTLEKLADSKNNKEKFSQNLHEFYSEKL